MIAAIHKLAVLKAELNIRVRSFYNKSNDYNFEYETIPDLVKLPATVGSD